jgi:hypothetical protein
MASVRVRHHARAPAYLNHRIAAAYSNDEVRAARDDP